MAGSVLHTLIEVSENFQELMRLAAADGVLDSWGLEVVLQNVALNLHEDDNFHGNLLFGLHSLLLLLARKLGELGHEVLAEGCGCGWDTSHLPESQHTDIHRYTSGTVVRWVRGECYVLLASTSSTCTTTTVSTTTTAATATTTTSVTSSSTTDNHEDLLPHQHEYSGDCAPEDEEYQDTTPGEVVSPEEGAAASGGDDDPYCYSEEAECCPASPSPHAKDTTSLEHSQQDSKNMLGKWSGCQVHSCFSKKREKDFDEPPQGDCKTHCDLGEEEEEQHVIERKKRRVEDNEEVEESEGEKEKEQIDTWSEEEEEEEKEQEEMDVSCEEEEEEEEEENNEISERDSWSNQSSQFRREVNMRESKGGELKRNKGDETDDTTVKDHCGSKDEGKSEEQSLSDNNEEKEEEGEGKEEEKGENLNDILKNRRDTWRGLKDNMDETSNCPLGTESEPGEVPAENVAAAVVSEESLDGDSSCTLIIHEEEDTSCREGDTTENSVKETTGEDICKSLKDYWSREDPHEAALKNSIQDKENDNNTVESCRETTIREENVKEGMKEDNSRKDDSSWREDNILNSCRSTTDCLWKEDTTQASCKENWREDSMVNSYKNTQEDSWREDSTVDSYKNTQESWREDTTVGSFKTIQEDSWREETVDSCKNSQKDNWREEVMADSLNNPLLQNPQDVGNSMKQSLLTPHNFPLPPKEKCTTDLFGLSTPTTQSTAFPLQPPSLHNRYDEEEEVDEEDEDEDDDDDDDEEEESDDDSSSVTSSSTTSSSSSSSSSSSDDDDRINFKQRVERAAQAAREAEASAAARLASAVTQGDQMCPSEDQQVQMTRQLSLPHHLENHTQMNPQEEDGSQSSSDEMTNTEDPGGGGKGEEGGGGSGVGSNITGNCGSGGNTDGGAGVGIGVAVGGSSGDAAPAVVVTVTPATAALVYVEPSEPTPLPLVPPCPDPCDSSLHSSRDPADLQAAQGLADLQRGQNQSLAGAPSGAPLSCTVVDQLQQIPLEVRRGGEGKGLECVVCGKVFNRLLKLKQHHRTHTGERPWGCTSCSKTFSRPAYLHNHRLSCHTPAHQQQFSCYVCQRGFGLKSALQAHLATHATNKPFTCDICGQTFALKFTRDTHKAQHTGSRPWVCSVCGRSYITKYKLRAHMKAHTGELVCSFCGRQFTSQDSLGRHQRLHEGSANKASPVLPTCSICNKKFATPSLLKRHITSHERQSAVKCGVCSQEFANHQQLTAHQTRQHQPHPQQQQQQQRNQAVHQCPVCNKVYVQEVFLTRHMTTHTTFSQQTTTSSPLLLTSTHPKETAAGGHLSPNLSSLQQSGASLFQQSQQEPSVDTRLGRQDGYLTAAQHQLEAEPQQHLIQASASDRTQTQVFLNYDTEILEETSFSSTPTQE